MAQRGTRLIEHRTERHFDQLEVREEPLALLEQGARPEFGFRADRARTLLPSAGERRQPIYANVR
jgi:hypothetical protein